MMNEKRVFNIPKPLYCVISIAVSYTHLQITFTSSCRQRPATTLDTSGVFSRFCRSLRFTKLKYTYVYRHPSVIFYSINLNMVMNRCV